MPATLATVDSILKVVYEDRITDQLQNEIIGLKRVEQTSNGVTETTGGKYVDFPVRVRRNTGLGYRGESGQLPVAGQQGYAEVHVPLKYGYGRFRVTAQAMSLSDSNQKAFARTLDKEQSYLKDDIAKDSARIFYGDGSGLLASLTEASTSASHVLDSIQYLEIGENVDVLVRSSGATVLLNTSITAINESTLSVTFAGSFTSVNTHGVYRQGSYGREPTGLGLIVKDSLALHTLDPASEPQWAAVVDDPSADRALSEGLMIQTCDRVRRKGGKTKAIFTSLGVRRSYFNLLTQQRSFVNTKEFAGGFTGLPFNYGSEIPVVDDVDAPPKKMWFLDDGELTVYRTKDWHYADDDGHVLKWIVDFDVWEGFMRKFWELATHKRNGNALLGSIIEG